MSFPFSAANNSQDPSHSNSPTSTSRTTRGQQSVWGSSNNQQQQLPRRGLTPLTTSQTQSQQRSGTSSPSRNPFSPTNPTFSAPLANRGVSSRHSSVSSSSSLFSPHGAAGSTAPPGRSRNTTGSPHPPSSATFSSLDRAAVSSTGATSRFARPTTSLSRSGAGSPVSSSGPSSAGGSGQLTSLVITQLNILLSTLKEDKDKSKWETQAEKIWKVGFLSMLRENLAD